MENMWSGSKRFIGIKFDDMFKDNHRFVCICCDFSEIITVESTLAMQRAITALHRSLRHLLPENLFCLAVRWAAMALFDA